MKVKTRNATAKDSDTILSIEVNTSHNPLSRKEFLKYIKLSNVYCLVAESDGQVVGFCLYQSFSTKIEIIRLAVEPFCRRMHIGTTLIEKIIGRLSQGIRDRIMIDAHEESLASHLFLKEMGFVGEVNAKDRQLYTFRYSLPVHAEA